MHSPSGTVSCNRRHSCDTVIFILSLNPFRVRIASASLASRTKPAFRRTLEICFEQSSIGLHASYDSRFQSLLRIPSVNFARPAPSAQGKLIFTSLVAFHHFTDDIVWPN